MRKLTQRELSLLVLNVIGLCIIGALVLYNQINPASKSRSVSVHHQRADQHTDSTAQNTGAEQPAAPSADYDQNTPPKIPDVTIEGVNIDSDSPITVVPVKFKVNTFKEITMKSGDAFDPKVSPDGSKIVFIRQNGQKTVIAIASLPSGSVSIVHPGLDGYANPSWNADGEKLVFAGTKDGVSEIYTYDLHQKQLFQVTKDPTRNKSRPVYSPDTFDQHYRIAYVSEKHGRNDIWWVRENGDDDRPLTIPPGLIDKYSNPKLWKEFNNPPEQFITQGGNYPRWSQNGDMILYTSDDGKHYAMGYGYYTWWKSISLKLPVTKGAILWSPNQSAFLSYNLKTHAAHLFTGNTLQKEVILQGKDVTSLPDFFPDGKSVAYTYKKDGRSVLAMEPVNDPWGDITNWWQYAYTASQQQKITKNDLLFRYTGYNQLYNLYESELYQGCGVSDMIQRPYFVTTDSVLETFYAAFSTLLGYTEKFELKDNLKTFASTAYEAARAKNDPQDIQNFFLIGLLLIQPDARKDVPLFVRKEIEKIKQANGSGTSLFNKEIDYSNFRIRGKYEREKELHGYFRALKWFQFKFDLSDPVQRAAVTRILEITNTPKVRNQIEHINLVLKNLIGESRYYSPLTLSELSEGTELPDVKPSLPWIRIKPDFILLPFIYTMDAFVFDNLTYHSGNPVGTDTNPRTLPLGMDIMASLGSNEAKEILLNEFQEGRYAHYEKKLDDVTDYINKLPDSVWNQNIYLVWLNLLRTLMQSPPRNAPAFTHTEAWRRKELNTALGSWVDLRYQTVAYVEEISAECGEAGYEELNKQVPRGYVEPYPLFFTQLDAGFKHLEDHYKSTITDPALRDAVIGRIETYRQHIRMLGTIAQKELDNKPLTDSEYSEILYVGRAIEYFTLIMYSLNSHGYGGNDFVNPDPIERIVDVQKDFSQTLYEAIGPASELDVIVPFFGKREIVQGPAYSYYEFRSSNNDVWNDNRWRSQFDDGVPKEKQLPEWIRGYYDGSTGKNLPNQ